LLESGTGKPRSKRLRGVRFSSLSVGYGVLGKGYAQCACAQADPEQTGKVKHIFTSHGILDVGEVQDFPVPNFLPRFCFFQVFHHLTVDMRMPLEQYKGSCDLFIFFMKTWKFPKTSGNISDACPEFFALL